MSNIELTFKSPWFLLLAIPALLIILLPFLRLPRRRRKTFRKIAPVVIHVIVVLLLVLVVSGFAIVRDTDEQAVILLVDLSDSTKSVQEEMGRRAQELMALIDEKTPVGVVVFGQSQAYTVELSKDRTFAVDTVEADATDLGAAMEYASTLMPSDKAGHIIILSDGKQTDGNAIATAQYLATKGIRIDAVYFDTTTLKTAEVQIGDFVAPEGAYVDAEMKFTAEILSNVQADITLSLYNENTLISTGSYEVSEGSNMFEITCVADRAGTNTYRLVLETATDTVTQNNEGSAYVKVVGQSTVLIIADTIGNAEVLANVLEQESTVTTVTAPNAPDSIIELCDYDEVILSNVDYDLLPYGYDALLDTYVSVFGRSLLVVGGEDTMMYGNMRGTQLEAMLPVSLVLRDNSDGKSVALMLVLDCSSSMSQQSTYLSVAKQGAIKCVEAMSDNDLVGVISFNSTAYVKSELIPATEDNKASLNRIISALSTSRGTYYTEALKKAHEELLKSDAEIRHIIFLSDGQPNDNGYLDAVKNAGKDGITVSTIGLGYSSDILENLAIEGGGRYYYVSKATDLPNIMLSETEQVTVSSLITGEFSAIVAEKGELTELIGTAALPKLYGYLGTTIKDDAKAYITTEEGHPVFASWNYGMGTVACFTSDLHGDWSSAWLDDEIGTMVTQNIVSTTVDEIHHNSSMSAIIDVRGQTTDIIVTAAFHTQDVMKLTAATGAGEQTYLLTQTEPGVYTGRFSTAEVGVYELMITQVDDTGVIVDYLETAIAVSYSNEYDAFADSGEPLLDSLCGYANGGIYKNMQKLSQETVSPISVILNPAVLFAMIAVVLMICDIAIRRLRWKDIKNQFFTRKPKAPKE